MLNWKTWLTAVAVGFGLFAGGAQAATCTVPATFTNPDASVTHSTVCGEGTDASSDNAVELKEAMGSSLTWTQVDKDEGPGDGSDGFLFSTNVPGGTTGSWGFDDIDGFDTYVLVIKDGSTTGDNTTWFWFVVDLDAGCALGFFTGQYDYCGTWDMYGVDGSVKQISHLSLYAASSGGGGSGSGHVPEPASSSLALIGLGLIVAAAQLRRRRR